MKAIVFGGSGFVGSHVADALTEAGNDVVIYDQKPSPYLRDTQQMVTGDILDFDNVKEAVTGCDVICNFAGLADIDEARTRPMETVRLNVLGNTNILEAARQEGAKRYVFASTFYVYSNAGGFYRASKQACEAYIEEYQKQFGLDYTILRYGTLYGRRSDEHNSLYRFLTQALTEGKVTYSGDRDAVREYIHVEDAAKCTVDILSPEYKNQHVILTGHYPIRIHELLTMINEILGGDIAIDYRSPLPRSHGHYVVTPYSYQPKMGRKLVRPYYLDMGQGILDCLEEIHHRVAPHKESDILAIA